MNIYLINVFLDKLSVSWGQRPCYLLHFHIAQWRPDARCLIIICWMNEWMDKMCTKVFLSSSHVSHLFTSYWCPGIVRHNNNRQSKAALVLYSPTHPHVIQALSHFHTEKQVTSAKIIKIKMDYLNIPRKKRKTSWYYLEKPTMGTLNLTWLCRTRGKPSEHWTSLILTRNLFFPVISFCQMIWIWINHINASSILKCITIYWVQWERG